MNTAGELVIVASCTHRKKGVVPEALRLSHHPPGLSCAARADSWRRALDSCDVDTLPACDLYAGGFWAIARSLPLLAHSRGMSARLLVASAGYGLVGAEAELKPYSATFAGGVDSVVRSKASRGVREGQLREWWAQLSLWKGPSGHRGPRSLRQIARRAPASSLLVVASPIYVCAMADDLLEAAKALTRPESLVIVSSRSGFPPALLQHLVPSVAALQPCLGGSLSSLHARTARHILQRAQLPLDAAALRTTYDRLASHTERPAAQVRKPLGDGEVRAFIRSHLKASTKQSLTALLGIYRRSGFRCEQSRFRALFREVRES